MKKLLFPLFILLFFFACEKDDSNEIVFEESTYENGSATTRGEKRNVCHNGKIKNVSINAIPAHQGHGDAVDMDQDGFFDIDNPCGPTDLDDMTYNCVVGEIEVTLPDGSTLYVHPTDNADNIQWGEHGNDIGGLANILDFPDNLADFDGASNTATILAQLGNWNGGDYAANLCATLSAETGCDWYLPAAGELSAIYQQLGPIPADPIYWSSSEGGPYVGWVQVFNVAGNQGHFAKNNGGNEVRCRCVRR